MPSQPNFSAFVYFVYGLAFFTMGISSWLLCYTFSVPIRLVKSLKYLSYFGIVHGFVEWSIMSYYLGILDGHPPLVGTTINTINAISFVFLMMFGFSNIEYIKNKKTAILIPWGLFGAWASVWGVYFAFPNFDNTFAMTYQIFTLRTFIAFPAGIITSYSIGRVLKRTIPPRGSNLKFYLFIMALCFGLYGIFAGLVDNVLPFSPFNIINKFTLYRLTNLPVEVIRAFMAITITFAFIRVIPVLKSEHDRHISYLREMESLHKERRALARDLHDIVLQGLFVVGIDIENTIDKVVDSSLKTTLEGIKSNINSIMEKIRSFMGETSKSPLEITELWERIEKSVQSYSPKFDVPIEIHKNDGDVPFGLISTERLDNLYYIINETLLNALKHSQSKHVDIWINTSFSHLVVSVADYGIGFDVNNYKGKRYGLTSIKDRIDLMGGELRINSSSKGTSVSVIVPWEGV